MSDISLFDALLMKFCKHVHAITPNMHMHGHIKKIMELCMGFGCLHTMESTQQ